MQAPIISIIVPVYKVEDFLPYTINSILAQTFKDWELLLIDDGSPDSSGKVCDDYAANDFRIKVVHKQNSGVSAARNCGLDLAQGQYIVFGDSDDLLDCDYLKKLYQTIHRYNADIVSCSYSIINESMKTYKADCIFSKPPAIADGSMQNLSYEYYNVVWGKIYKRSLISLSNLRFNENMYFSEDTLFIELCTFNAQKIVELDYKAVGYRKRTGSITNTKQSFFGQAIMRYDAICSYSYLNKLNKDLYNTRKEQALLAILVNLFSHSKPKQILLQELNVLYERVDIICNIKSSIHGFTKKVKVLSYLLLYLPKLLKANVISLLLRSVCL